MTGDVNWRAYNEQIQKQKTATPARRSSIASMKKAYGGKRSTRLMRNIKSAPGVKKRPASGVRRIRRPKQMGDTMSAGEDQILYNIESQG